MRVPDRAAAQVLLVMIATGCSIPHEATTVATSAAPRHERAPTDAPPGNAGAVATTHGATAAVDAELVREGYRVVRRHDQILYCRSQSVTGTLFASTVCLTASQIASQKRELQQSKDLLNQGRATQCVGPECVGK